MIAGYISYFGLQTWWLSLPESDRNFILKTFTPMSSVDAGLISGEIHYYSGSAVMYLTTMAEWFVKTFHIAKLILEKAENLINNTTSVTDKNYFYSIAAEIYYKQYARDPRSELLDKCISICEKSIEIAPEIALLNKNKKLWPLSHPGYETMLNIQYFLDNRTKVEQLVSKVKSEGWSGKWDRFLDFEDED